MDTLPWKVRGQILTPRDGARRPLIAGILNATPDSFFDGGAHDDLERAVSHGHRLWEEGADMIDVGGESTRPGCAPVSPSEEIRRVVPVVASLCRSGLIVSVDTRRPEVAQAALEAGAHAINDIEGLRAPKMIELCRAHGAGACAMHMRGSPATMQTAPDYRDVAEEVALFLEQAALRWEDAGLPAEAIALDPGIGFGKTLAHNQALLRATESLRMRFAPRPWYLGLSRKSFIARTPGVREGSDRLAGSLGAALAVAQFGADILRVHDVAATLEALALFRSLQPEHP